MKIVKIEVGQLKANCYLLVDEKSSNSLIVDPGDDSEYINRIIIDKNTTPKAIIATHGHFDHIMAVFDLRAIHSIPFLMNSKDVFLLERMQSSAEYFTNISSSPPPRLDAFLEKGDIKIDCFEFEIILTPGHTPGGVSLYFQKEKAVFVGDLVFANGYVGRTDFKYSSGSKLNDSILLIKKLPPETKVYSGHGDSFFVKDIL